MNTIKKGKRIGERLRFQVLGCVASCTSNKMVPESVKIDESNVQKFILSDVPLENIAVVLNQHLKTDFQHVQAEVVECPDLREPPFTLACEGLNGDPVIIDGGGVPYLLPKVHKNKLYDLRDFARVVNLDPCYMTGAGAGPWPYAGTNCEMMINMEVSGGKVKNRTRIAKVDTNGKCLLDILPDDECRNAILSNIYCSRGMPGKVLKIHCRQRTGNRDFATTVRTILDENFKDEYIGLGGVILIREGKVRQHVMPDFSTKDIGTYEELNRWLRFYEMSAPLVAVGTLMNRDPGLDLRVQHFHSFSHHGEGGHYHNDTTPENVEYLAYFGLGKILYRIDKPEVTHQFGRD